MILDSFNLIVLAIIILILLYLFFGGNNKSEHMAGTESVNEAIQNIASLYNTGNFVVSEATITGSANVGSLNLLPTGVVVMWNGTTAPKGWALCDGTQGTPDLRGRFILGYTPVSITDAAGNVMNTRVLHSTGGSEKLVADVGFAYNGSTIGNAIYMGRSTMYINGNDGNSNAAYMGSLGTYTQDSSSNFGKPSPQATLATNVYGSNYAESMPPYFVLAYIMKL